MIANGGGEAAPDQPDSSPGYEPEGDRPRGTSRALVFTSWLATIGLAATVYVPLLIVTAIIAGAISGVVVMVPSALTDPASLAEHDFANVWLNLAYLGLILWRALPRLLRERRAPDETPSYARAIYWSGAQVFLVFLLVHVACALGGESNSVLAQWLRVVGTMLAVTFWLAVASRFGVFMYERVMAAVRATPWRAKAWSLFGMIVTSTSLSLASSALSARDAQSVPPRDRDRIGVGLMDLPGQRDDSWSVRLARSLGESMGLTGQERFQRCLEEIMGSTRSEGYTEEATRYLSRRFSIHEIDSNEIAKDRAVTVCARHRDSRINGIRRYYFRAIINAGKDHAGRRDDYRTCSIGSWEPPGVSPSHDLRQDLERALQVLNTQERQIFSLRHIQGEDYCDIARRMGISEGAARQRTSRLNRKLQDELILWRR